jgi:hypothetical protein
MRAECENHWILWCAQPLDGSHRDTWPSRTDSVRGNCYPRSGYFPFIACVNRRATRMFVYSVLLVTCVAAIAVAIAVRWLYPDRIALLWHDVLGAFRRWLTLLLPGAFLWACVKGSISRGWIPTRDTRCRRVVPIGFILGVLVQ